VYAVDHSVPKADRFTWKLPVTNIDSFTKEPYTLGMKFKDTGIYEIALKGDYGKCGFRCIKTVHIIADKDSSKIYNGKFSRGPLIREFYIAPNPNDGMDFKLVVKLRDTANIAIFKIDPITGNLIGDYSAGNKK